MAEAMKHYQDRGTMAMARFISRRAVEAELRRQGHKLSHYSAKDLTERADDYLREHTDEVMQQVRAREWEREVVQILKLAHRKRKPEIKAKSLCVSHAQNGARQ
jgi:hypothetical protein